MKKIVYLMILVFLLTILTTACDSEETKYAFPLERKVVEKVLAQEGITWDIEENPQSFNDGHMLYVLKNRDDKIICNISSFSEDTGRYLAVNFYSPSNLSKESLRARINEDEWEDMFKLACVLYGNDEDYKKAYQEFLQYSSNRRSSEYGQARWYKRIDEVHFEVILTPLEEDMEDFTLLSIQIMNNDAYEEFWRSRVNQWLNTIKREEIEIHDDITVSDIISMKEEDSDFIRGIIIKGHLENIRKLNNDELPSTTDLSANTLPYIEDYLSAELVDDTGSIQVIIPNLSLNKEELNQLRNHYGYYFSEENVCVIDLSIAYE
ncbi:hypothetical protein SAMN05660297_03453 [Natronincola peptidivorans]|uniref:Uncharacterized protein n=1 Tax=Natronincola peptidivorans TaxID=426128 RepID=A0A1I0H0T6_9FIRM|nr:hypothetical protein [Natronincola peptidivorans]SET77169.1 hypothetical protein SAMN05660297_03453 [Natronincola peptidivorans]